ncbi:hypothetical protein V6N13_132663 [Hibiscus sabdariffa]
MVKDPNKKPAWMVSHVEMPIRKSVKRRSTVTTVIGERFLAPMTQHSKTPQVHTSSRPSLSVPVLIFQHSATQRYGDGTRQHRTADPDQNTGIVIETCRIRIGGIWSFLEGIDAKVEKKSLCFFSTWNKSVPFFPIQKI